MSRPHHDPVMLDRVVALLMPALGHEGAALVDAALELAGERLRPFEGRFTAVHAVYDELPAVLVDLGLDRVDAVLFDLGVSSMQLDLRDRGFAYREDAPLDMRMDGSTGRTAADVLNTYPADELARVLKEYGEERFARRIAAAVVREREREPFTTSARLVELLYAEIPAPARRKGGHPAKRTFQALRMEVNDELAVLRRAIPAAIDAISVGGRVVVESYHSLEDRVVKRAFADAVRSDVPEDLPFVPEGSEPDLRLVTRGAEKADQREIRENPRAASVRLRAIERVSNPRGVAS
jgi:16S rRNA (cytosine1402-N4)-methyltransferase